MAAGDRRGPKCWQQKIRSPAEPSAHFLGQPTIYFKQLSISTNYLLLTTIYFNQQLTLNYYLFQATIYFCCEPSLHFLGQPTIYFEHSGWT